MQLFAATYQSACMAIFSTYGSWVYISAPGVGIWSSWHTPDDPVPDYISTMDGTSMATPLSASVAALIWSQNPTWTAAQVRQRLFDSADPIESLPCNFSLAGNIGDGGTSSAQSLSNTYNTAGIYTVKLTVTGPGGTDENVKTNYITVSTPPPAPIADFSASPTSGNAPLHVVFTDQSTGTIGAWSWRFGDGYGGTIRNPSHTYEFPGTYNG